MDSGSRNDEHYPLGDAHGVHTLMKGLVTRLPKLIEKTTAEYIILMEGDCRWIPSLVDQLDWLQNFVEGHNFVWPGFFQR